MPLKQSEGLLSGYRAAKEQEALKKKHGINSPEVVVIEKKSAVAHIPGNTYFGDHRTRSTGNCGAECFYLSRPQKQLHGCFWRYRSTNSKFFRNLAIYA